MKNINFIFLFLIVFSFFGCDNNSNEPQNTPPVIQSVTSNPTTVKVNGIASLTAEAADADGDELIFQWSAEHGSFPDGTQDSTINWQAPESTGDYAIKVTVSDGENSDEETILINTKLNSAPEEPTSPLPTNGSNEKELEVTLSWSGSDPDGDPVVYDIYLAFNEEPELVVAGISDTSFTPGKLYANTKYYWRVVAKDGELETIGELWNFTTQAAANNFEFVTVPAGEFTYGKDNAIRNIDYDFHMMKYEVSNTQYIEYLTEALAAGVITITESSVLGHFIGDSKWPAGEYELLNLVESAGGGYNVRRITWDGTKFNIAAGYEDHPVILVTWFGANAFANYYGLRLPSEEEWEKTARGNTGWWYPWGNSFDGWDGNFWHSDDPWEKGTTPVGWYNGINPETRDRPSVHGAYDMMGNVWEWTSSYYSNTSKSLRLCGGAWNINATNFGLRCYNRDTWLPDARNYYTGFRCSKE